MAKKNDLDTFVLQSTAVAFLSHLASTMAEYPELRQTLAQQKTEPGKPNARTASEVDTWVTRSSLLDERKVRSGRVTVSKTEDARSETVKLRQVISERQVAWTVPELAKLLQLSRRALYEHIEQGRLPAIRIGTALRLCPNEVQEWFTQLLTLPT